MNGQTCNSTRAPARVAPRSGAPSLPGLAPAPNVRLSVRAERTADILAIIKRCGAASIYDVTQELELHHETVRKLMAELVAADQVVIIEPCAAHSRALYGMPELDEQTEFDQYRARTSNWPRGQALRDPLVAALFGAPLKEACA